MKKKAAKKAEPKLKSWIVPMRYTIQGVVIVEATDADHAQEVAKAETPEMDGGTELVDWETYGHVEENV